MVINEEVRTFLQQPLIARVATISPDGYPHVVPIWFMVDGDDVLFITDQSVRKVRNAQTNPKGAVSIGGDPAGTDGYLLQGDFAVETDPQHHITRQITYRYQPEIQANATLRAWENDDIVVLRLKVRQVIKV